MPLLGSLEEQGINVADNRTYLTNRTNEVGFRVTAVAVLPTYFARLRKLDISERRLKELG